MDVNALQKHLSHAAKIRWSKDGEKARASARLKAHWASLGPEQVSAEMKRRALVREARRKGLTPA